MSEGSDVDRPDLASRLGLGSATLMREPAKRRRRLILEHAYAAGYRYVDTSPLYGLGRAEEEVGSFLRGKDDVRVGTKFGLSPTRAARTLAYAQRPGRAALRRLPRATEIVRNYAGARLVQQSTPDFARVRESAWESANRLGRSELDVFLLHEPEWDEQWVNLISSMRGWNGAPWRRFGLALTERQERKVVSGVLSQVDVLQREYESFSEEFAAEVKEVIVFGMASKAIGMFRAINLSVPARDTVERLIGHSYRSTGDAIGLVATLLLVKDPRVTVVLGSSSPDHLVQVSNSVRGMQAGATENYEVLTALLAGSV